jgi:tRNA (adenine37-N6)-methyltransferase
MPPISGTTASAERARHWNVKREAEDSRPASPLEEETMKRITYLPIGIIRSPFREIEGMPIQPLAATGIAGRVEIAPEYVAGLKDLGGFSHLILLYHFHFSEGYSLEVKPFLDDQYHGVFATRAPKRPNPLGLSVVRLIRIDDDILHIADVDIADGTPLLDIKPYIPAFDAHHTESIGWFAGKLEQVGKTRADWRFK